MALYKGNRGSGTEQPSQRRSPLHRSRVTPPPTEWPDQAEEEQEGDEPGHQGEQPQSQSEVESVPPEEGASEGTEPEIQTGPPSEPVPQQPRRVLGGRRTSRPAPSSASGEGTGQRRVLGGGRRQVSSRPELPAYKQTIVIGGDAPKEPPPSPPEAQGGGGPGGQPPQAPQQPPQPQGPPIDERIIAEAQAKANEILQQAQAQAQQMLNEMSEQAQQQAQAMAQQAAQQGYDEGMQAGLQAGQQAGIEQSQQYLDLLKREFVELVQLRRQISAAAEPQVVRLALEIAEKIVGQEIKTNKEVIVGIVRQGIATLGERDEITVRVNPDEYDAIKEHQSQLESMVDGLKKFEVLSDGAIAAGSCAIETNLGNVDARISTQFEAIRLGLEDMIKIRSYETEEKLAQTPVEVPGDPEFHQRMKAEAGEEEAGYDDEEYDETEEEYDEGDYDESEYDEGEDYDGDYEDDQEQE